MPAHSHSGSTNSAGAHTHSFTGSFVNATKYTDTATNYMRPTGTTTTSSAGAHSHTITIGSTGSGQAHNNMPPYVTYYCWERTA